MEMNGARKATTELDQEWIQLMKRARDLGISILEVQQFLQELMREQAADAET